MDGQSNKHPKKYPEKSANQEVLLNPYSEEFRLKFKKDYWYEVADELFDLFMSGCTSFDKIPPLRREGLLSRLCIADDTWLEERTFNELFDVSPNEIVAHAVHLSFLWKGNENFAFIYMKQLHEHLKPLASALEIYFEIKVNVMFNLLTKNLKMADKKLADIMKPKRNSKEQRNGR